MKSHDDVPFPARLRELRVGFIQDCDAYTQEAAVTRTWLSKRLFNDTYRLDDLANDKSDIGVKRLERAWADLVELRRSVSQSRPGAAA